MKSYISRKFPLETRRMLPAWPGMLVPVIASIRQTGTARHRQRRPNFHFSMPRFDLLADFSRDHLSSAFRGRRREFWLVMVAGTKGRPTGANRRQWFDQWAQARYQETKHGCCKCSM